MHSRFTRGAAIALALGLVLVASLQADEAEERAVRAVIAAGGRIGPRNRKPGKPVSMVRFDRTKLTDAQLGNLATHLPNLKSCGVFSFSETKITDAGLKHLAVLKDHPVRWSLYVDGTAISDAGLKHLTPLRNLRILGLGQTRVSDAGLKHLAGLSRLEHLDLNRTTRITDAGLMHLAGIKSLTHLDLDRTTTLTDAGLRHLARCRGLKRISLGLTNKISRAGVEELKKALPNCTVFSQHSKQ